MTVGEAQICATIANFNSFRKAGSEPLAPKDFMPTYGRKEAEPEEDDGMAPEKVLQTMERLMRHQEKVAGRA